MPNHHFILSAMAGILMTASMGAQTTDTRLSPQSSPAVIQSNSLQQRQLRHVKPRVKGDFTPASRVKRIEIPRKAPSATPVIHAVINDCQPVGVYTFTPEAYSFTPVKTDERMGSSNGATYHGGRLFNIADGSKTAYTWNTDTWDLVSSGQTELIASTAMATDPTDGTIYACAYNILGNGTELVTVDSKELVRSKTLCTVTKSYSALFFDNEARLWGLDTDGNLFSIDKTTGTPTLKGDTGIPALFNGAAVVDPASGVCFYAACDWDCGLYEIDLSTATASLIYNFDDEEEISALYILPPPAAAGSPGAGSDPVASFPDGNLTGSVTFSAPAKTADGSTGNGILNYALTVNGETHKSATCDWGDAITLPYTAPSAGQYSFSVTFSNTEGTSPATAASLWIGRDTPRPVTNVKVTRSGEVNTVTWDASSGAAHGGYIIMPEVTYRVTRMPDNVVVSQGNSSCSYADNLPDGPAPAFYSYIVNAVWGDLVSDNTVSGQLMVGAVYYNGFDTAADFDGMTHATLINGASEWEYNSYHKAVTVSYNEDSTVDAWLSSPAVQLEAGRTYTLSFDVWVSNSDYNERLQAFISTTNSPQQLYQTGTPVIDNAAINWEKPEMRQLSAKFTPGTSGAYYITLHGCSPRDLGTVYADNLMLAKDPARPVPAAPVIKASVTGGNVADVSVTAPGVDTENAALASLSSLVVDRGGENVFSKDNPTPGATYTFTDNITGDGNFTYTAYASNENGRSESSSVTVSAAVPSQPKAPTSPSVIETATPGEVTVSWSCPTMDIKNHPLTGSITYKVYAPGSTIPAATVTDTDRATFRAVDDGKQEFVSFTVTASNTVDESARSRQTDIIPAGTPDKAPYKESFSSRQFDNLWIMDSNDDSDAQWLLVESSATPQALPHDSDGGMLAFTAEFLGDAATLTSGKIYLGEGDNPRLTFWYFAQNSKAGKDQLDILVNDGSGFRRIDSFTMRDEQRDGWTRRIVPLDAYAGKTVSLRLRGESFRTENFMLVDEITITNIGTDFEAQAIIAPGSVIVGSPVRVEAFVANNGAENRSEYSVVLYVNDKEVDRVSGESIASAAVKPYIFEIPTDASSPETIEVYFDIEAQQDEVPANNRSEKRSVAVTRNSHPAVKNIGASWADDTRTAVDITWHAPVLDNLPVAEYTDNFEHYEPFLINPVGDWTFVDGDGDTTYGPQMFPYDGMEAPKAFVSFDAEHGNQTYAAHSGRIYLAAYCAVSKPSDDWMISPELTGDAQTISFYARSYSDTYGLEQFEVLASSAGPGVDDFKVIIPAQEAPVQWTRYTADLPEGSKYFAVRYCSNDRFAFFIDDVTYTAAVNPASHFIIRGYNLFRDGKRLNSEPLTATSYRDPSADASSLYRVSVIYDRGESPLSNGVRPGESGIENTVGTDRVTVVAIYTPDGQRVAAPVSGVNLMKMSDGSVRKILID